MCNDIDNATSTLEVINADLKDAIALGDLSENATYDNLIVEKRTLTHQLQKNKEFIKTCEVLTPEELVVKYPWLYARIKIRLTDVSTEKTEECTVVPTADIDVRLKDAVRAVDPIGKVLLETKSPDGFIRIRRENIIMEILEVEPYTAGSLVFEAE